ncbi:uncharacterized protein MYCFIDRAFT_211825 [Pseudocercospora fijiensis CIRAD86]|uniref:Uncharacterized protein n=1 Tax=Pseudocercospora fijiensis (strain CIRAD86) TaxID=383855 RepID=M2YUG4_PSEFD|nr:uncharacterized protein MYCFIDRAFT_211825 [Pseudocercospora fijiensis CIRAD86]EME81370.1 hypothetical protein MYCFIDRAFT_211825 [Pseudocercospora fijiensis CIRAD86]
MPVQIIDLCESDTAEADPSAPGPAGVTARTCDKRTIQEVVLENHRKSKNHPVVWKCYRPQGCGKKFPDIFSFFTHLCFSSRTPEERSAFHMNMKEIYGDHGLLYPPRRARMVHGYSAIESAPARQNSPVEASFQDEYASDGSAADCMGDCMDDEGMYRHLVCSSDAGRFDCRWCEQPFGSHARYLKHEKDECIVKLKAKEEGYDSAQSERECAGNCADEDGVYRHRKCDEKWLPGIKSLEKSYLAFVRSQPRRECFKSRGGCGKSFKTTWGFDKHSCARNSRDPTRFTEMMLELMSKGTQHTPKKIRRPRTSLQGTNANEAGGTHQKLAKPSETGISEAELVFAAMDAMSPPSTEVRQFLRSLARQHANKVNG